jgi:hypothetical protein
VAETMPVSRQKTKKESLKQKVVQDVVVKTSEKANLTINTAAVA